MKSRRWNWARLHGAGYSSRQSSCLSCLHRPANPQCWGEQCMEGKVREGNEGYNERSTWYTHVRVIYRTHYLYVTGSYMQFWIYLNLLVQSLTLASQMLKKHKCPFSYHVNIWFQMILLEKIVLNYPVYLENNLFPVLLKEAPLGTRHSVGTDSNSMVQAALPHSLAWVFSWSWPLGWQFVFHPRPLLTAWRWQCLISYGNAVFSFAAGIPYNPQGEPSKISS